jgi:hypothetical protein
MGGGSGIAPARVLRRRKHHKRARGAPYFFNTPSGSAVRP